MSIKLHLNDVFRWEVKVNTFKAPAVLPSVPPPTRRRGSCVSPSHSGNTRRSGRCDSTASVTCGDGGTGDLSDPPWPGSTCGPSSLESWLRGLLGEPGRTTGRTPGRTWRRRLSDTRCISPPWPDDGSESRTAGTSPPPRRGPCFCSAGVWGWTPVCTGGRCTAPAVDSGSRSPRCSPGSNCVRRGSSPGPSEPPDTPNNRTGPLR